MATALFVAVGVWCAMMLAYTDGWRKAREASRHDPWLPPEVARVPAFTYAVAVVVGLACSWLFF